MMGLASPFTTYVPIQVSHNIGLMPFWMLALLTAWSAFEQGGVMAWALFGLAVGLGAATVVSGHGAVAGPEVFDVNAAYLRWIRQTAAAACQAGLSPLEAARETGLGDFAGLLDPERIVGNLHRAYAEERGEPRGAPLDLLSIFLEMAEYNGGAMPACYA